MCLHFSNNKCITKKNSKRIITLRKKRFYWWDNNNIIIIIIGLVMCYEPQAWGPMAVEKMYIIYFMHFFIQSSSSNHWNKFNFDSKWTLNSKMLSCTFKFFKKSLGFPKDAISILAYCIPIIFVIHHFFGWKVMKNGSPVVCFHMRPTYWHYHLYLCITCRCQETCIDFMVLYVI